MDSSINSAVFIDEKAKDFFSETAIDTNIPEEKLSVDLFKTFKENGKNLAIHKFEVSTLENSKTLDYLFNGRDLILLDWELADVAGQEHSLKLLNKVIGTPCINFCCIYSSSANFNQIPLFLEAYFSGVTKAEYDSIKETYGHVEIKEVEEIWGKSIGEIEAFFNENKIERQGFPIERLRKKPIDLILRHLYVSLVSDKVIIPEQAQKEYEVLNTGNDSFIINNTFVLTLKKDVSEDSDYKKLLKRISDTIIKNNGSFFQLLGMEMQSVFNSNERFIDDTILKSSTEALFQFRNHIRDDKTFGIIIKKLLIEQATLKLRTAKLKLLETEFLDYKSGELNDKVPNLEDLFQLNVFYNSVSVKSLHPNDIPNLNFGDVFKDSNDEYYLCITALCDCYYPNKIQHNFYFAKGNEFRDKELALKLGDTAFISFLPNNKVVHWGDIEYVRKEKIKKGDNESEDEFKNRKCNNELEAYKVFLYKPFYIKPKVYNVENNKLEDNKIRIWDITNKITKQGNEHNLNYFHVEYITTLREDYTQRIANHAFGHPSRVGVDFVKIK
ncbi:hypothetical protein KIM67_01165 [Flagellimonas sp. 389]|nr:response regulator receiver domain [uncultured Allomuricauda sp.]MBS9461000.1 hypothetical protein [Flagellimonas sp. 389]